MEDSTPQKSAIDLEPKSVIICANLWQKLLTTSKCKATILEKHSRPSENLYRLLGRNSKNLLLVLSTGYIFVYFSEHFFWARIRPEDSLGEWIGAWVACSLMAFVFPTTTPLGFILFGVSLFKLFHQR